MTPTQPSSSRLYITYNVAAKDIHVVAKVKKVGNSLALFIPADQARAAGLADGQTVQADIRPAPKLFGILKDRPYEPFTRDDLYDE